MRDGIVLARNGARKRGIARLTGEAESLGVDVTFPSSALGFATDWVRADAIAQSYAARWLKKANELDSARAASIETQGSLERIAVTESSEAFNAGRSAALGAVLLYEYGSDLNVITTVEFRLMRAWDATLDRATCPICEDADGTLVGVNEPFPAGEPGSVHVNCFVPDTTVHGAIDGGLKARYSGDILHVRTVSGRRLTVTPNHPILTPSGFRAAGDLRKGDDLLGYAVESGVGPVVLQPNVESRPSNIAEIFDSLRALVPSFRGPGSRFDLHGDAKWIDGDIHVVNAKSTLWHDMNAIGPEHSSKLGFPFADIGDTDSPHAGSPMLLGGANGATPACIMCGSDLRGPHRRRHHLPFEPLRFGLASEFHALAPELITDRVATEAAVFAKREQRGAGNVSPLEPFENGRIPHGSRAFDPSALRANGDASAMEAAPKTGPRDSRLFGELLNRFSGLVAVDQVAEVGNESHVGHVFDLQSSTGWIVANGLFTSNCRCMWTLTRVSFRE